jgi:hypothetical protein
MTTFIRNTDMNTNTTTNYPDVLESTRKNCFYGGEICDADHSATDILEFGLGLNVMLNMDKIHQCSNEGIPSTYLLRIAETRG